jgi:hypothetical protein
MIVCRSYFSTVAWSVAKSAPITIMLSAILGKYDIFRALEDISGLASRLTTINVSMSFRSPAWMNMDRRRLLLKYGTRSLRYPSFEC